MKKTISINIKGFVFNIEEDAYATLQNYIQQLKRIFRNEEGGNEIVDDVEMRIAELFNERISENYQAITDQDVEDVIQILGAPEDYETSDEETSNAQQQTEDSYYEDYTSEEKKLYRDPDRKAIGGVCSGIAHYLGWDVVVVRILFILFMFSGLSIIIYAILYFVVPEATTTAEKLHMKGERINVENIKKKVNKDFDQAKEAFKSGSNQNYESKLGRALRELLEIFGKALQLLGKVVKKGFGAILLALGLMLFFGSIIAFVSANSTIFNETGMDLEMAKELYIHGNDVFWLGVFGATLLILTLLFVFIYNGIRILFDFNHGLKNVNYILISSFIVGAIMLFVAGVSQVKNYSAYEEVKEEISNTLTASDTLIVSLLEDPYFNKNITHDHAEFYDLTKITKDEIILGKPIDLYFRQSNTNEFTIEVRKSSHGNSTNQVFENIEKMDYEIVLEGNELKMSPYLKFPKEIKHKDQRVEVVVYVPDSAKVFMEKNLNRIDIDYSSRYLGRYLSYKNDELRN